MLADLKNIAIVSKLSASFIATQGKKTASELAKFVQWKHDKVASVFKKNVDYFRNLQKNTALSVFAKDEQIILAVDDTVTTKNHAKNIEGVEQCYSGGEHRPVSGLQFLTVFLTNGKVEAPYTTEGYNSKKLNPEGLSKQQISLAIIEYVAAIHSNIFVVADAHYSTKLMIAALCKKAISFLMKFSRNKHVTHKGVKARVDKIVRLKKNNHYAVKQVTLDDGIKVYCYAIKLASDVVHYYVSNALLTKEQLREKYGLRWGIEKFHRTAKQLLGWNDCQMRSIEKQTIHRLLVMHAYTAAGRYCLEKKLPSVDAAIKQLRVVKPDLYNLFKPRSDQHLDALA